MSNINDFVIENGVLKKYNGSKRKVVIPEGVTSIGNSAFSSCDYITSVVVPEGVTSIGDNAFMWCESLKSVNIPSSVTHIGNWAFDGCDSIDQLIIPDEVDTIGEGAFCGCINMADEDGFLIVRNVLYDYFGEAENVIVPSFVTSISYGAFKGCDYIRSVIIPESVEHISPGAFCGCTGLADEDGFVIIRDVLYNYSGKNDVITIPPGVVSISDWAFSPYQGRPGDGSIVHSYKQPSSQYHYSIKGLVIPESVRTIGAYAFYYLRLPDKIEIPENVTSVGLGAFSECGGLKALILPEGVKEIQDIFKRPENLEVIVTPGIVPQDFKKSNEKQLAILGFVFHMERYRNHEVFKAYCQALFRMKKNILPLLFEKDCVQGIALFAQAGKITVENFDEEFFRPAMEANATECVAYLMEWRAKNLSEEAVVEQMEKALNQDPYQVSAMKKLWSYKKLVDGTLSVTGYKGSEENVVIPPRIGNDPVTAIDERAFSPDKPRTVKNQKLFLKTRLRSVTLPDGIISVGDFAFCGCEQLECVNFTQKRILFGDKVFWGCNNLSDKNGFVIVGDVLWSYYGRDKEIIIPEGITAIGSEAFYRNYYIKELTIPESVAFIGKGAFRGCSGIEKLVIPQSVNCVDNMAFYGCYGLEDSDGFLIINNVLYGYYGKSTEITIPEGVTAIGEDSFYNRTMDNVTVPEGVISIGKYAFQNANIGSVTLPQSVTSIGELAFGWGSTSLVVKAGSYAEQYAKDNGCKYRVE